MLLVAYPVVLFFLIPVVFIEALYIRSKLKTSWWNTTKATARANIVTMLLGYPLAWFLMLLIEFGLIALGSTMHPGRISDVFGYISFALAPAWLAPSTSRWPILLAFTILLIPSFFLSGYVEAHLLDTYGWLDYEGSSRRAVWIANILSYSFLAAAGCLGLWMVMRNK